MSQVRGSLCLRRRRRRRPEEGMRTGWARIGKRMMVLFVDNEG